MGNRARTGLGGEVGGEARPQSAGKSDVLRAQTLNITHEIGLHGRVPERQRTRGPGVLVEPTKKVVAAKGRIVPARSMQMGRLLHGQGRVIGAAAPELIPLFRRCHVLHHEEKFVGFLIDGPEVEGGDAHGEGGGQLSIKAHLFKVVLQRDARLPTGGVIGGKFSHHRRRPGPRLVIQREADVLPDLPRADIGRGKASHGRVGKARMA